MKKTEQNPIRTTRLHFYLDTLGDRETVLLRRDEIIEALKPLGIRLSMTDAGNGTYVYLSDQGVQTMDDALNSFAQRNQP